MKLYCVLRAVPIELKIWKWIATVREDRDGSHVIAELYSPGRQFYKSEAFAIAAATRRLKKLFPEIVIE